MATTNGNHRTSSDDYIEPTGSKNTLTPTVTNLTITPEMFEKVWTSKTIRQSSDELYGARIATNNTSYSST
jgi:hypothetical protein